KPCQHKRANHQHGTHACYVLDRCRCLPCATANSAYESTRVRNIAYGRTTTTDAGPVRAHLHALMTAGMGLKQITAVHGISAGSLTKILYGITRADGTRRPPTTKVLRRTADRVLAISMPTIEQLGASTNVDSTGARRRIQALIALGWSVQRIADDHGISRQAIDAAMRHQPIYARNALAIREAFDTIGDRRPPERTAGEKGAAARSRKRAEVNDWAVPAMWDEADLDDPYATPPTMRTTRRTVDLDEWARLVRYGENPTTAARRCGVGAKNAIATIDKLARVNDRADILALLSETRNAA
uniref:hypothetical protein n=1 Tax=Actinotalea sp. TaxID=1872145 RepID=UPI00356213F3